MNSAPQRLDLEAIIWVAVVVLQPIERAHYRSILAHRLMRAQGA